MLAIDPLTLRIMANLGASLILVLLFIVLVANAVLLWGIGKGLAMARFEVAAWAPLLIERSRRLETAVRQDLDQHIYQPQIESISRLRGLRAGLRALVHPPAPRRGGEATGVAGRSQT